MADTTALKNRIRAAIKANDNQEITGPVLQQTLLDIVDELDLYPELENEATARQQGDNTLQQNITAEATARQQGDTQLNNLITGIKNNIDNGYVYAGIATPSTNPVSGKVFYIATVAGTYTNFGGQVLTQGINILRFNGSAWSNQQLIGIDDVPTTGSNNLVKSGGVNRKLQSVNNVIGYFDQTLSIGTYILSNGLPNYSDIYCRLNNYTSVPVSISVSSGYKIVWLFKYEEDGTYIGYNMVNTDHIILQPYQKVSIQKTDASVIDNSDLPNVLNSINYIDKISELTPKVAELMAETTFLDSKIGGIDRLSDYLNFDADLKIQKGCYVKASGVVNENTNLYYSMTIANKGYTIELNADYTFAWISKFDTNKTYLGYTEVSGTLQKYEVPVNWAVNIKRIDGNEISADEVSSIIKSISFNNGAVEQITELTSNVTELENIIGVSDIAVERGALAYSDGTESASNMYCRTSSSQVKLYIKLNSQYKIAWVSKWSSDGTYIGYDASMRYGLLQEIELQPYYRLVVCRVDEQNIADSEIDNILYVYNKIDILEDEVAELQTKDIAFYAQHIDDILQSSVSVKNVYPYTQKRLMQFLITTDIHADWVRLQRAVAYMDKNVNINGGFCLGDYCDSPNQYEQTTWEQIIELTSKPFLPIIGNHDAVYLSDDNYMSDADLYDYFFSNSSIQKNGEIHSGSSLYWYKDYTKTYTIGNGITKTDKIRVIGIDSYQMGVKDYERAYIYYKQEQIDWLIATLKSVEEGMKVIMLVHTVPTSNITPVSTNWNAKNITSESLYKYQSNPDMICAIVQAWIDGSTINLTNINTYDSTSIVVNDEFSAHENGFIAYLCGHSHADYTAKPTNYQSQRIIGFHCTTANDGQQGGDLGRSHNGKAQDAVSLVSYNFDNNEIRLVRLGASRTIINTNRDYCIIS